MERVEVLSYADVLLYSVDWIEAIGDVFTGRADIVENHEHRHIGMVGGSMPMPKIIKFKSLESITKSYRRNKAHFSRTDCYIRDNGTCQYCGTKITRELAELEHIVPRSRGGVTSWENCVMSCHDCNSKKGNKTPHEAGMRLIKTPTKPSANQIR